MGRSEILLDSILEPLTKSTVRLVQIRGEEFSSFRAGYEDMVGAFIDSLAPTGSLTNVPSVEKGYTIMGTKPEEVVHSRSSLGKSTSSHSIGVFAESLDEQPYGKHVCF